MEPNSSRRRCLHVMPMPKLTWLVVIGRRQASWTVHNSSQWGNTTNAPQLCAMYIVVAHLSAKNGVKTYSMEALNHFLTAHQYWITSSLPISNPRSAISLQRRERFRLTFKSILNVSKVTTLNFSKLVVLICISSIICGPPVNSRQYTGSDYALPHADTKPTPCHSTLKCQNIHR